jgi:multidrug efflux system outer membrane protein
MNDGNKQNKIYSVLIVALAFSSCVTQKYQQPGMASKGQLYRDTLTAISLFETDTASIADTSSIAGLPYTQLFTDTVLQGLIAEGIRENLDLKIAVQRISEAQANLLQSRAAFLPSLDGNARVARNKQSIASLNLPPDFIGTFPLTITSYQASLSTSWEADVWGKLKSAKRIALANLLASDAVRRAVQTQVVATIATYYYQLLSLDQQLRVTEQTLKNRIADVATMKILKENAVVTGAAVVQSEANRYAAEVTIPYLKRSIRETENALSILLAKTPGPIRRTSLTEQTIYADLQTGIPSLLLKNRPDVQQAEFAFRAAFENTNLARTYFYPQLTLTAEGGVSTIQIKNLFNRSIFYSIIGGLTQPIFARGQNKARLRIAQAQQQEAYYSYQQSLLNAGEEVSNALFTYQTALEAQASRKHQIEALEKAVSYTKQLLEYSSATNYTDVLTSEQALLAAQLSNINDRLLQLQAVVNLYQALGGGWQL